MAFVLDYAFLPATLSVPPMTDEEFVAFCAEHPDLNFEMTSEGELIVMAPTYSFTGVRNGVIFAQLYNWTVLDGRGFACDSSSGFVLPNGARRSPDASWTHSSRTTADGFWHLCPDFVIELKSDSDRPRVLAEKMNEYLANERRPVIKLSENDPVTDRKSVV